MAGPTRPEANAPPVIEALSGPATAIARGAEVVYEVTATDRDNDPLTFEWTFSNGDFFVTSEPRLAYTWPAGGDYTITVLVDDLEPFHRVSSDPTGTSVTDPLTSFSGYTLQDNEDFEVPFHYQDYVLDRFFLGAREGETEGQLYSSWDGLAWEGPVLVGERMEVKKLIWDGARFLLVAMEWDSEREFMVGSVYMSSGGRLWTKAWQSETADVFYSAAWEGSQLLIGMQDGRLLVSQDLLKFSKVILPDTPTKGSPGNVSRIVVLDGRVYALTGNAVYKLDEGQWSLSGEFPELRKQMLVVGKDAVVLAGEGPQVWSTSDGSTWTNERFYGVGAEPVEGNGMVTELLDVQGVLWARYRPDGDGGVDECYLKHAATGRWTQIQAADLPDGSIMAHGAGRLVSAHGVAGWMRASSSLYPENTAPSGEIGGPSEARARVGDSFMAEVQDPEEDVLSRWWDQGPGLPWVRGGAANLAWSTGGSKTLTHWVTDMKGGLAMLEQAVLVEDPLDSWTEAESPSQEHLATIALGQNGRLVAVGSRSVVMRSDNAEAWIAGAVDVPDVILQAVAYTGTHFLAVGSKDRFGYVFRSVDGELWNNVWIGAEEATDLRDIKMIGDAVLAVGAGGLILRSTDHGLTWGGVLQDATTDLLRRISYGGGKIVVSHWTGTIVSTDGLTWVDGNAPELGWNHVHWVKDRFINTGWRLSEGFWSSMDGENWERPIVVPQESYEMPIVVGVGDLYYAMGDYSQGPHQVAISVDGVHWFAREAPRGWSRRTGGLIYEDTIVTVGNNGQIWRSSGLSPQETKVVTFRSWQESHLLEGLNGPNDDPDGDGWSNLVEFALWMKADDSKLLAEDGVTTNPGVRVFYNQEAGTLDLEHFKPQLVERLTYQLRYTLDFKTWYDVELLPEEVVLENGGSRVLYRDLEQLQGVSAGRCFFEITVTDLGGNLGF